MTQSNEPSVPAELLDLLLRFNRESQRTHDALALAHRGLSAMARDPDISYEAFVEAGEVLYASHLVTVWAALEACINDFLEQWLLSVPAARQHRKVAEVKGSLVTFWEAADEERAEMIIAALGRDIKEPEIGPPFGPLLALFDLDFSVPTQLKDRLNELRQIRHLYAHGHGYVDAVFLRRCPTLRLALGERLRVTPEQHRVYIGAAIDYVNRLMIRAAAHFGVHAEPPAVEL